MIFVAIFGATMTPYEFFWQASEEAEENVAKHKIKDISREDNSSRISRKEVRLMRTSR
jgi:Mn2+/Fe2+ NRAMP family transporter